VVDLSQIDACLNFAECIAFNNFPHFTGDDQTPGATGQSLQLIKAAQHDPTAQVNFTRAS
jgi:hypothetical protein